MGQTRDPIGGTSRRVRGPGRRLGAVLALVGRALALGGGGVGGWWWHGGAGGASGGGGPGVRRAGPRLRGPRPRVRVRPVRLGVPVSPLVIPAGAECPRHP